jgi:hypothetical protein
MDARRRRRVGERAAQRSGRQVGESGSHGWEEAATQVMPGGGVGGGRAPHRAGKGTRWMLCGLRKRAHPKKLQLAPLCRIIFEVS